MIRNREILHKILEYETLIRGNFQVTYDGMEEAKDKIYDMEDALCDYTQFNANYTKNMQKEAISTESSEFYDMPIVIKDPEKINLLANSFVNFKAWSWSFMISLKNAEKKASELIALINSEYQFK